MFVRFCILFLLLSAAASICFAHDADSKTHGPESIYPDSINRRTPQRFTPDSARIHPISAKKCYL